MSDAPADEAKRPSARRTVPAWASDVGFSILGLLFGAVSLTFPFGRDQGLYFYVAREWVVRGSVPYRDVLDHKTPGIYFLHALAILLFGEKQWGIRVLELGCMVGLGVLAGSLTAKRGEKPAPGVRGLGVLSASVLYFGFLDFWNTAQSEFWYATLGIAGVWAASRVVRPERSALAAGAFGAAAMIMKPPAIWFVLVALAYVAARAREPRGKGGFVKRLAVRLVLYGVGVAAVAVPVFGYFAAKHALGDLIDIVGGANSYYVRHETGISTLGEVMDRTKEFFRIYNPFSSIFLFVLVAGFVHAVRTKDAALRERHLLAAALCAAGYAGVAMQAKFYLLHWGVVVPPATVVAANVARDVMLYVEAQTKRTYGAAAFVAGLFLLYGCSGPSKSMWLRVNGAAIAWLRGEMSREDFTREFELGVIGFWYHDSEQVGLWLKEHSTPDDLVAVRGFQPEIYAVAERHYGGRFFWTTFLVNPARAYKREQWMAEDVAAFAKNPPRFVVSLTQIHEGIDSSEYYFPMGYVVRTRVNELTILERTTK